MESKADNIVKGVCSSCQFRHSPCPYWSLSNEHCKHWKLGKCYTCKFLDDTDEEWFKRGCESECLSGCSKYERNWKRTFNILKRRLNKEF